MQSAEKPLRPVSGGNCCQHLQSVIRSASANGLGATEPNQGPDRIDRASPILVVTALGGSAQ